MKTLDSQFGLFWWMWSFKAHIHGVKIFFLTKMWCNAICNQNAIVALIKHHHCVKINKNHNKVKVEISLCNICNWNREGQSNTKHVSLHVRIWSTLFLLVPNVASITTILWCPCIIIISFCIGFGFPQWKAYCVLLMNLLFHGQILNSKTHNVDFVGHAYAHFLHHFCVVGMLLGLIILIGIEHLVEWRTCPSSIQWTIHDVLGLEFVFGHYLGH